METTWINEVADHAGTILHDAMFPPKETPSGVMRKAAINGPQFYTNSGKGNDSTKRKDIQPYDELNIHTWTSKPLNEPSPSRTASLHRISSIRRTSKGNLVRLSPTGAFNPVVDTQRDPKHTFRQQSPEALSSNRRTPRSVVSEPWNKADVIIAGENNDQIISRIARKDLTLQVATKRTGELIAAINQHSRNANNNNNNNNYTSGTINDENHHQRERTNNDDEEVYSIDADHQPHAGRPSAYQEDNVHDELEHQHQPPLGEMQELTSFSQLYDSVFNGDIVALLGSFAAERFKRVQQQAAAGAPTKTLLNKLVRPSTGHQRKSSPPRGGQPLLRPHSSPAIVDIANMGDDGTTVTPNTKRIRDEIQWATGAGSLYLEMAAALLANKELRDIIFTTEEFQKIVKEEQAHVAMLQNHRTTPQSVFRDSLLFYDKLPHTSKFLEGCVCVALSNCPPIAAIVEIYDRQWRMLSQAYSRTRSRSPMGGVSPTRSPSSLAAHSPTSRPKSSRWGGHGGIDGIDNGMPAAAALAIITDETADADAGIDFDDGESGDDENEHDFADQLLQLPDFHRAKIAAAEKVAIFPQPRTTSAKKPTAANQERVQSPTKIRLASGKDLMARTYERPSITSQTSLPKELPRGRQKKKRPHSSFGTSIRIHWPTREWKLKKYEQFSFASYSAGPMPGQEYLDRARQFEERMPLVQRVQSATSTRGIMDFCAQPRERLRDDPRGSPLTSTNGGIIRRLASAHRKETISPHTSLNTPSSSHHSMEMYPQLRGAQSPSLVGEGVARLVPQPSFVRRKKSDQIHQAAADMLIEEDEEARERKTMKGYSTRFWWKHDAFFTMEKKEKSPLSFGHYPPRLYHNAPENLAPPDEQYPPVRRVPVLQLLFQSFMRELLLQTLAHVLETGDDEVGMSPPNQQSQQQPYQLQQYRSVPTVSEMRYQQYDVIDDMAHELDYSQEEFMSQQGGPEVAADVIRLRPRSAMLPHISSARESEQHQQVSGDQRGGQPPSSSTTIAFGRNSNLARSGGKEPAEEHVKFRARSSSRSSTSSGKGRLAPSISDADMLVGHLYQDVQDAVAMMGVLDSDVERSTKQVEQFDARTGGSRRGSTVRHALPGHFELKRDPTVASVRRLNLIFSDVREQKAVQNGVDQLRKQYDELQQQNLLLSKKVLQVTSSNRSVESNNQ